MSMTTGAGTTTYSYDDAGRLTQVQPPLPAPPVPYTWDDNGDLTARDSDTFTWDYEDRMTSATVGGTTSTFTYRGDGLRDSRTTGGNTTAFTWDINAALPEVLDDGARYIYGAGLESMLTATGSYYYLADGLGSTMAMVDSTGIVAKSYTYDVYGTPTSTGALANEYDFAGQQTDPTGLQYLRARYMDPESGTFVSREPLAIGPAWIGNHFAYAASRPISLVDPSGRRFCDSDECSPGETTSRQVPEAPPAEAWPGSDACHGGPLTAAPCLGPVGEQPSEEDVYEWLMKQFEDVLPLVGEYVNVSRTQHPDAPRKVTGITDEGLERILFRSYVGSEGKGVATKAIVDALRNPKAVVRKTDELGRVSFQFRGKDATVVLIQAGEIVTTWATSTRGMRFPPP
ncbi:MAG: RHS repeat-associated core domain-containing protein [Dehalococcoidia bacterium]|nr:RHS repeat-associated core domain-containing protein [Dehalococcoidia bacterium]